jgi:hypothetical protein
LIYGVRTSVPAYIMQCFNQLNDISLLLVTILIVLDYDVNYNYMIVLITILFHCKNIINVFISFSISNDTLVKKCQMIQIEPQ